MDVVIVISVLQKIAETTSARLFVHDPPTTISNQNENIVSVIFQ